MSPYQEALNWILLHPTTGGANSLAMLTLSLWNSDCCFSFGECVGNLDEERTALAVRMVKYFSEHGEDADLVTIGHQICKMYPGLWDLGQAATQAKHALRRQWEEEEIHGDDPS